MNLLKLPSIIYNMIGLNIIIVLFVLYVNFYGKPIKYKLFYLFKFKKIKMLYLV